MNRYPDMGNAELYGALSGRLGVPVEHLALATGSVALIYQLVQAFCEPGDEVVYAWRSFEAYPIAVDRGGRDVGAGAGAARRPARPRRDGGGGHRPHQGGARLHAQQPDRPGRHAGRARRVPGAGARRTCWSSSTRRTSSSCGWPTRSTGSRRTAPTQNVLLTRTFSKAYGLAGFRVGYAVGPEPIAGALRAVSLPFGVSSVAQAAAVASLAAEDALLERVAALVAERDRRRRRAARGRLGRARSRRATSSGSASATGPPSSPPPLTSSASWCGRSPARAPGSRSASRRPTTGSWSWRTASRGEPPSSAAVLDTIGWRLRGAGRLRPGHELPPGPDHARRRGTAGRWSPAATGCWPRRPARGRPARSSCGSCSGSRT